MEHLHKLREDYQAATLERSDCPEQPQELFTKWLQDAIDHNLPEPNAFTLSTVDKNGRPQGRIVLLKELTGTGFVFYTNYESQKGQELEEMPWASMTFVWLHQQRQVRVSGRVEKVSKSVSEAYFISRPKGSQLGAWASHQSEILPDRTPLENRYSELEKQYANQDTLPKPDFWGGFIIIPDMIEFWQGRTSRLHDRMRYTLQEGGKWTIDRLSP